MNSYQNNVIERKRDSNKLVIWFNLGMFLAEFALNTTIQGYFHSKKQKEK